MCNLSDAIEERGIRKGEERGIRKGEERGIRKGEERGEKYKIIELVSKKVKKGKILSVIADELEEDEAALTAIYEAVLKSAPDYNNDEVYENLYGKK